MGAARKNGKAGVSDSAHDDTTPKDTKFTQAEVAQRAPDPGEASAFADLAADSIRMARRQPRPTRYG